MQVHGYYAVNSGHAENVGHELGRYGNARLVFAVLARPAEIWNHSYDCRSRSTFCGVNHKQKFHKVVAIGESGLNQIYLGSADGLLEANFKLAVSKVLDVHLAKLDAQLFAYGFSEIMASRTCKNFDRRKVIAHC